VGGDGWCGMNYYNEFDSYAAEWIRNLIAAGEIPPGDVDTRSIKDVTPDDAKHYTQCHFFAGIAGWSLALRLAGWPADRPVWTGSCPCQPYSSAGKQKGNADERDLWPELYRLARICRPDVIFGEQVSSAIKHGWIDRVHDDMERENYAVGSAVLGAFSVAAPHKRSRLYWVAESLADARHDAKPIWPRGKRRQAGQRLAVWGVSGEHRPACAVAHADGRDASAERQQRGGQQRLQPVGGSDGPWSDFKIIHCLDGKSRRVPTQREFFPLVDGIPRDMGRGVPEVFGLARRARANRTGRLRGYGNAIVPQVAAEFIAAWMDVSSAPACPPARSSTGQAAPA